MITNHADFEVLCALAASGDLTNPERAELSEHVEHCVLCHKRLFEMRQLGAQLFLAQALKGPVTRLPKGMQERFSARAISEGIPLNSRSQGAGFSALGLVSALLAVLLLVAATLRDGQFRRSVAATDGADAPYVSQVHNQVGNREMRSPEAAARPPRKVRTRSGGHRPSSAVFAALSAPQGRQFTFTPYSRNSGTRAYPLSTTVRLPEIVPSFAYQHRTPKLSLDATSEVFRHLAPHLLAECEHGAFGPFSFRSDLDPAPPVMHSFPLLKVDFKASALQPIQDLVP
jgi:hypothetical protein